MFKGRIQMRAKLVRMFMVVSLLTMGLLVATPTPAFACHGYITIVKKTDPEGGTGFNFSGDLGSFTLNDDEKSEKFYKAAGSDHWYDVTESVPSGWGLDSVVCAGGDYENITDGVSIHLESNGQEITCTFTNKASSPTTLEMEKTSAVSDDPLMAGSTITYTIVATNPADSGGSNTNIVISDTVPTGTTYVGGSSQVTGPLIVRDEFSAVSYGNNDGNVDWFGAWQEIGDGGAAGSGRIQIASDQLLFQEADDDDGIKRKVDLSGATSVYLTFDWYKEDCEEDISVYVSDDGSSFDLLDTFTGTWRGDSESYNISAYAANTTVLFQNRDGNWTASNDKVLFDNVQIRFRKTVSGGAPPNLVTAADGYSLLPGESMTVTFQVTLDNPIPDGLTEIENTACVTSGQVPDPICDTTTDPIGGTIIVDKVTNPSGDSQSFDFTPSYGAVFSLTDAAAPNDSGFLSAGNYSVSETVPDGWELTSATCSDGSPTSAIVLDAGETVTCTFTNTKLGTVIINKTAECSDDTFSFSGTGDDIDASFAITTSGGSGSKTFNNVAPGAKTVTESTLPTGWSFDSLVCTDPDGETTVDGQTANIDLDAGETVECTFTNTNPNECGCQEGDLTGADDLWFSGKRVTWDITNNSSTPRVVERLFELQWPQSPTDNGNLVEVKFGGTTIWTGSEGEPATIDDADPGWTGSTADCTLQVGQTKTLELTFVNNVEAHPVDTDPYVITVEFYGVNCDVTINEGAGATAVTLSSFAANSSAGGSVSRMWLGLIGTVLAAGSLFWARRRTG